MSLFGRNPEKAAQAAAAEAELERLRSLPVEELAVAILPALGPDGIPHARAGIRVQPLCKWLVADYPGASKFNPGQLMIPVRDALQRLEHANLVSSTPYERQSVWRITTLGETALAENATERYLSAQG